MIKKSVILLFFLLNIALFIYIFLPAPRFPAPPADSLQSDEPADTEDPLRRAYFTDLNRQEVIAHYKGEFNKGFGIYAPTLNYPPEEAQSIIRDQTRSTYLQELVHPLRESLFINGFEPQSEKDTINIKGRTWKEKIIVRYVPSGIVIRVVVLTLTIASAIALMREYNYVKRH